VSRPENQANRGFRVARLDKTICFNDASRLMPEIHTLTGNIQQHRGFRSKVFANRRDLLVYLPRGYRRSLRRRYPVLYLQDGQNVFDAATAFAHVEWRMDETAQELIRKNLIEPLIIVAIANVGEERIHEYTPTRGVIDDQAKRKKRSRGMGRQYARFLIDEVKPFIDRTYRTRPEPENTGLGGSSLGGLITLATALWCPDVFQRLIVMSPSIWWDGQVIVRMVEELPAKLPLRIWLDTGTNEPGWERARKLRDAMIEKGWRLYDDLQYLEVEGADHSEGAWAQRVDPALRYLFPPPPSKIEPATRGRSR
jgi:predicted alpha/beta superfamily hydrolase